MLVREPGQPVICEQVTPPMINLRDSEAFSKNLIPAKRLVMMFDKKETNLLEFLAFYVNYVLLLTTLSFLVSCGNGWWNGMAKAA